MPNPPASPLRTLLEQQSRQLDNFSDREARLALRVYRQARAELSDRLEFLDERRYTAQAHRNALVQVQRGIGDLERRLGSRGLLGAMKQRASHVAWQHLRQQVEKFEAKFKGSIKPLPIEPVVAIESGESLLLQEFDSSVSVYGMTLIRDMQQRLAVSLLSGESGYEAKYRLFGQYLEPLRAKGVPTTAYWAERIVRTETISAYNTSFLGHLRAAAQTIEPGLKRRWSAAISERTCRICMRMNGKIATLDQPFVLPDKRPVVGPPAHPNCRCATLAWMDEWAEAAPEVD